MFAWNRPRLIRLPVSLQLCNCPFFCFVCVHDYNKPLSKRVRSAVILVERHLEKLRRTWSTERSSPSRYSRVEPTESESLWDRKNANSRSGVRRAGPSASAPTALRGCVKTKRTAWPASRPRKTLFKPCLRACCPTPFSQRPRTARRSGSWWQRDLQACVPR